MTGEKLKEEMSARNLNVKKVADMLCVAERTVYQWLNNSRQMPKMADELFRLKTT